MSGIDFPGSRQPALALRVQELFNEQRRSIFTHADRLFSGLLVLQYLVGIALALWISPLAWESDQSTVHSHVWAALVLGGAIISLPAAFGLLMPGWTLTRHFIAVGQMLMGALLIHLTGGRLETHFHVFGSLALLSVYRDWRVLISASVIAAADHYFRGSWWPRSVYGVLAGGEWRWLEHTVWVIFEDIFLLYFCVRGTKEMFMVASRRAELEETNSQIENVVHDRTRNLISKTTELELRVGLAEMTSEISAIILTGDDLKYVLKFITNSLTRHLNLPLVRVWLCEVDETLKLEACSALSCLQLSAGTLKFNIDLIAQEKNHCLINDIIGDSRIPDQDWVQREGLVAYAGYPLLVGRQLMGVLEIFHRQAFSELNLNAFVGAAGLLAVFIDRMKSQHRLNEQTAELICINEELSQEVIARAEAEHNLIHQTNLLETVLQSMGDAVVAADCNGKFLIFNQAAEDILGYGATDQSFSNWSEHYGLYQIDGRTPFPINEFPLVRAMRGEIVEQVEFIVRNPKKSCEVILSASARPFVMEGGKTGSVVVFHDCTKEKKWARELQASIHEKEALLKEIHHRVKNNLQIISSLLNLQITKIKDPEALEAFHDSQDRVRSMGLIHETLYRSGNLGKINFEEYVKSLCNSLIRSYGMDKTRIQFGVNVVEAPLRLDQAIPCGLIINELVSNALKYAFPKGKSGRIDVELTNKPDAIYSLSVSDSGIGLPAGLDLSQLDSLGLNLVNDLTEQLGGSLQIESSNGAMFRINFSMAI